MEEKKFKVIIVEDVKLELKGTEEIFRHEILNAEVIGTAMTENEFWPLIEKQQPDMVLLTSDWVDRLPLEWIFAATSANVTHRFACSFLPERY